MRIFDRILLVIYAIVIILLSFAVIFLAWQFVPSDNIFYTLELIFEDWRWPAIISAVALVLIIISIRLLISGIRRKKVKSALIKQSEAGTVYISIKAIEALVKRYLDTISAVSHSQIRIIPLSDGINLDLRLGFLQETYIEQASIGIQAGVAEYVKDYASLTIKQVRIFVDTTTPNAGVRV